MFYKFKIVIVTILLGFCSIQSIGQEDETEIAKEAIVWQPAYVVMKTSSDTIHGMMSTPRIKTPDDWVNFYTVNKNDVKKYKSDSISAFKYKDTEYKFFKYSGWSILIHKGTIDVYKGHIYQQIANYGSKRMECLVFKKGDQKTKFIGSDEIKALSGGIIKQKTKDYFIEYISDNPELLKEFNDEKFKYDDLENLIVRYNNSSKK